MSYAGGASCNLTWFMGDWAQRLAHCPLAARNCSNGKSGTKKEPKPKRLSPDIFCLGRGLPRERVGAKKFGMSLETREIQLFWRGILGFCRDIPAVPKKFEKRKFVFNFRATYSKKLLLEWKST